MFPLLEPSEAQIQDYLAAQQCLPFSYKEVRASKVKIPSGYPINHRRVGLGNGADCFTRAQKAIQSWSVYRLAWTRLYPFGAPVSRRAKSSASSSITFSAGR